MLTGGRPLLSMWTSEDRRGETWTAINLAHYHNQGEPDPRYRFTEKFAASTDFTSGIACKDSSCYTSLSGDGNGGGVVCYNLYKEAANETTADQTNTSYVCMRFSIAGRQLATPQASSAKLESN